jgi:hypothetical protein
MMNDISSLREGHMIDGSSQCTADTRKAQARIVTLLVDPEPTTLIVLTNSADPTMLVSGKINEGPLSYDSSSIRSRNSRPTGGGMRPT